MDASASKRGSYTGEKASKDPSSLLSRLVFFAQMAKKQNQEVTLQKFRESEGRDAEKVITLAVKKGFITLKRSKRGTVISVGPNASEVRTHIHLVGG